MRSCYNCNTTLSNKVRTGEHVLPNAIGGRLVSYKLLCRRCNVFLGETVDAALAFYFEGLCVALSIARDRPKRAEKVGAERWTYCYKGSPFLDEKFNVHMDNIVPLFKAVAKIALSVYLHFSGDRRNILTIVDILNDREPIANFVKASVTPDPNLWYTGELSHLVHIKADPVTKSLRAVVTLFNSFSFCIILSENYRGTKLEYLCRFDLGAQQKSFQVLHNGTENGFSWLRQDFDNNGLKLTILRSFKQNLDRILQV